MPVFATSVIFGVFAIPEFSTGIYRLDNTRPNPAECIHVILNVMRKKNVNKNIFVSSVL